MPGVNGINEIAQALSLSESTVSRALSGKGRVSAATRRKVLNYAEKSSYVPNSIAQSLVTAKTNTLAYLMTHAPMDDNASFFRRSLEGVCHKAASLSYDVIVVDSDKSDELELRRLIAKRKADGVILNRELEPAVERLLEQFGVPYVLLGCSEDSAINQVDTDVVKAGEELVCALIKGGVRKFAYIGEFGSYTVNKRRAKGFTNACGNEAEKGIFISPGLASRDDIDEAVRIAVESCECIVAGDDIMCLRVMNALGRMKVAVPHQIKLASLYYSYMLDVFTPRITSINHNSRLVGENAAKILINMLEDKEHPKKGNKLWVGYELLIRESTG